MEAFLLISFDTEYRHIGWSLADCPHCGQLEAARVEEQLEVVSLYLIPVQKRVSHEIARCDFCERFLESCLAAPCSLEEWTPQQGVNLLIKVLRCDVNSSHDPHSDERLISLLNSVSDQSKYIEINASLGMKVGGLTGALVGFPSAYYLHTCGFFLGKLDNFGSIFASLLCGIGGLVLMGVIAGAIFETLFRRNSIPRDKIHRAVTAYSLDIERLVDSAKGLSPRIQRAVRSVRKLSRMDVT